MAKRKRKVYFGDDSIFKAVKDIGRKGLNTREEFIELVAAQVLDLADLRTRRNTGRPSRWTLQLWNQRCFVLRQLNKKKRFGLSALVKRACSLGRRILGSKDKLPYYKRLKILAKFGMWVSEKYGVSPRALAHIIKRVNENERLVRKLTEFFYRELGREFKKRGISPRAAARRLKRHIRRIRSLFNDEDKRIAAYLWDMIPKKYRSGARRLWTYLLVLHLARWIRKKAKESGVDWRDIDWATEIDWRQGYYYAKSRVFELLGMLGSKYEGLSEEEIEQMMEYWAQNERI